MSEDKPLSMWERCRAAAEERASKDPRWNSLDSRELENALRDAAGQLIPAQFVWTIYNRIGERPALLMLEYWPPHQLLSQNKNSDAPAEQYKTDLIRRLREAEKDQLLEQGEGVSALLGEAANYLDGVPWK